jgi:hypothetical protein
MSFNIELPRSVLLLAHSSRAFAACCANANAWFGKWFR